MLLRQPRILSAPHRREGGREGFPYRRLALLLVFIQKKKCLAYQGAKAAEVSRPLSLFPLPDIMQSTELVLNKRPLNWTNCESERKKVGLFFLGGPLLNVIFFLPCKLFQSRSSNLGEKNTDKPVFSNQTFGTRGSIYEERRLWPEVRRFTARYRLRDNMAGCGLKSKKAVGVKGLRVKPLYWH